MTSQKIHIILTENDTAYISGHTLDNNVLFPGTGYLDLARKVLVEAIIQDKLFAKPSVVVLENVRFIRATVIPKEGSVTFDVNIHKGTGHFEILTNGKIACEGYVHIAQNIDEEKFQTCVSEEDADGNNLHLNSDDFYKLCASRGYTYKGEFQSVVKSNADGTRSRIRWSGNWVTFMDSMIQTPLLQNVYAGLQVPVAMDKVIIDFEKHRAAAQQYDSVIPCALLPDLNLIEAGGIQIKGLAYKSIVKSKHPKTPILQKYEFTPYFGNVKMSPKSVILVIANIVFESLSQNVINVVEITDNDKSDDQLLYNAFQEVEKNFLDSQFKISIHGYKYVLEENVLAHNSVDILIFHNILDREANELQNATKWLVQGGFVVCKEKLTSSNLPVDSSYQICCSYECENYKLLLLRKKVPVGKDDAVVKINSEDYSWIAGLKNLAISSPDRRTYVISEKDTECGILGLVNCLRTEDGFKNVKCVFILDNSAPEFSLNDNFYTSQLSADLPMNVYQNGQWGKYVQFPIDTSEKTPVSHAYVNTYFINGKPQPCWLQGPISPVDVSSDSLVHVCYASLNSTDVLLLSNRIAVENIESCIFKKDYVHGTEFSGLNGNGNRCMGICKNGALSTLVRSDTDFLVDVPNNLNLQTAATLPSAYFTAIYGLLVLGEAKSGDYVFVDNASNVVSRAAINILKHYGCVVFAAVSTIQEKQIFKNQHPEISEKFVGLLADTNFQQFIINQTEGAGVKIVFSDSSGDRVVQLIDYLSKNGHFIQFKRIDTTKIIALNSAIFTKKIHFHYALLEDLFDLDKEQKQNIKTIFERLFERGVLVPFKGPVFEEHDLNAALKFATRNKNSEKTLIKICSEDTLKSTLPDGAKKLAIPRLLSSEEKVHIICGGIDGLDLEIVTWLISRGAKKIFLTSKSDVLSVYKQLCLHNWKRLGITVITQKVDISNETDVENLLKKANSLGPVATIFNGTEVIFDKSKEFKDLTEESFKFSVQSKLLGARNLDRVSRVKCPNMEHFIVFSSVHCEYGYPKRIICGMANSALERLSEKRRKDGYPSLVIEWNPEDEVEMTTNTADAYSIKPLGGFGSQSVQSCLDTLDTFMYQTDAVIVSTVVPT